MTFEQLGRMAGTGSHLRAVEGIQRMMGVRCEKDEALPRSAMETDHS